MAETGSPPAGFNGASKQSTFELEEKENRRSEKEKNVNSCLNHILPTCVTAPVTPHHWLGCPS